MALDSGFREVNLQLNKGGAESLHVRPPTLCGASVKAQNQSGRSLCRRRTRSFIVNIM
jgi:hypothetical protein